MSDREDEIRRVVAELDVHIAEVEAGVAALMSRMASTRNIERNLRRRSSGG